jgi:hypothetical protein
VALSAVSAEFSLMNVVFPVAIGTRVLPDLVSTLHMTGYAGNRLVLALEREPLMPDRLGSRRVEARQWAVALGALGAELALVLVLVAIDAVLLADAIDPGPMTTGALRLGAVSCVESDQRELGIAIVVERPRSCPALDVTARAWLVRKLTLVSIRVPVTGGALSWALGDLGARLVARRTPEIGMFAEQRKAERLVIDAGIAPGSAGLVTFRALGGQRREGVTGSVAVDALSRRDSGSLRRGPFDSCVTAATAGSMLAYQGEPEWAVIDLGSPERAVRSVTATAVRGLLGYRMRRSMAVGTGPRLTSPSHQTSFVALGAGLVGVLAPQDRAREIRMRLLPVPQDPAPERLAWRMAGLAFLGELRPREAVSVAMAGLAIPG